MDSARADAVKRPVGGLARPVLPRVWAPGYRTGSRAGAVAQLGERLNGIQEVRGSIPLGSTNAFRKPL